MIIGTYTGRPCSSHIWIDTKDQKLYTFVEFIEEYDADHIAIQRREISVHDLPVASVGASEVHTDRVQPFPKTTIISKKEYFKKKLRGEI